MVETIKQKLEGFFLKSVPLKWQMRMIELARTWYCSPRAILAGISQHIDYYFSSGARKGPGFARIDLATVFLPREHIFFLEEWVRHHLMVGVDRIYLYDNTGVQAGDRFLRDPGAGISKRGEDFGAFTAHWSDDDIHKMTLEIIARFEGRVFLVPWTPRNKQGEIWYGQILAHRHYLKHYASGENWALFIDLDEFIWTGEGYTLKQIVTALDKERYSKIILNHKRFWCRYTNEGPVKSVYDITECVSLGDYPVFAPKSIVNTRYVIKPQVHRFDTAGKTAILRQEVLRFNHYTLPRKPLTRWLGVPYPVEQRDTTLRDALKREPSPSLEIKHIFMTKPGKPQPQRQSG